MNKKRRLDTSTKREIRMDQSKSTRNTDLLVLVAGIYLPPPLVEWFRHVAAMLG